MPAPHADSHVLLHGFLGSVRSWDEAPIDPRRRITPDLFGHGALPPTSPTTDFDVECRRLLQLSPPGSHLLGYSMGARVALALALEAPSHFSSVTLIGVNPGIRDLQAREERRLVEAGWCEQIREQGLEAFVDDWQQLPIFSSQLRLREEVFERQRAIRTSHFGEGIIGAIESLGLSVMPDYWPRLAEIRTPLTLVCGALDETFLNLSRLVRSAVSHARLEIIEDCGHNPVLERPEKFWASI